VDQELEDVARTPNLSIIRKRPTFPGESRAGRSRMVSHSPPRGGGSRYDPRGQYTLIREMKGVAVKAEREGKSRLKKMAKARGGKFQVGYSSGEQDRAGKEYSPLGYRLTKKIQSIIGK